MKTCKHVRSD